MYEKGIYVFPKWEDVQHEELDKMEYIKVNEAEWENVHSFTNLKGISLVGNRSFPLPEWLIHMEKLEILILHSIEKSDLPILEKLPHLNELYLSLGPLPEGLERLSGLKRITIQTWGIIQKKMEESSIHILEQLPNLEEFTLYEGSVTEDIGRLKNLKQLSLSSQPFTAIAKGIKGMPHLEVLRLRYIKITDEKTFLEENTKLVTLELKNCGLTEVPEGIQKLSDLKHLIVSSNRITSLPPWFKERNKLQGLDISNNQFTKYPEELEAMTDLKCLNLADNHLGNPPEALFANKELEMLDVSRTGLNVLSQEMMAVKSLSALMLNGNSLQNQLSGLGQFTELTILELEDCNLTSFPEEILHLKKLKELKFSKNPIEILQAGLGSLPQLTKLDINECKIKKFPEDIQKLVSLEEFYYQQNPLSKKELEKAEKKIEIKKELKLSPIRAQVEALVDLIHELEAQADTIYQYGVIHMSENLESETEVIAVEDSALGVLKKAAGIITRQALQAGAIISEEPDEDIAELSSDFAEYPMQFMLQFFMDCYEYVGLEDDFEEDIYMSRIMEVYSNAQFIAGWSGMPPLQEEAYAIVREEKLSAV